MKELFRLLAELAITYQNILDIKRRRLVIDEIERVEDEVKELEKQIGDAQRLGEHDRASLLLKRHVRRAHLSLGLDKLEKGTVLQSPSGHDAG